MSKRSRLMIFLSILLLLTAMVAACGQTATPESAPEATEAPAEEPVEEPAEEPTEEPAEEPTEEPAEEPTEEPAEEPTEEPAEEPTEEGAGSTMPAGAGGTFQGAFPYQVPPTGHLNSFVPNGIPNGLAIYWNLLEMSGAMYRWGDGTWVPMLVEEWEMNPDEDTFVINLREGVKWSDGSDFTSADVVATFNMGRLFKWTVFQYVDTVTALDEYTVEFHMSQPSTVVERYVLGERIRSAATYGELADQVAALVEDGADSESDEWVALVQEATEFRPEELIVTGPFNIDMNSVTEAQLTLVKNPESYLADTVQFDTVVLFNGETPVVTPLVLAGDVDYATHGFPPATESAFVDQGLRIVRAPTYSGPALYFNHDIYPLNRPEVRQAIAYAINREENGIVSLGDSGRAVENMAGFSDNLVPLWLSEEQIGELNPYAYDPAAGEEILTGIGFTKGSDGVWVDDQGNPLEFELTAPAEFADWSAAAENASEQLNNFGIRTTVRGVQFQQHLSDVNQGNFEIAIRAWGIGSNPHPHFSFVQDLFTHNFVASTEGAGMNFPMQQEINGAEVDFEELVVQAAQGLDVDAQKENVAAVAEAFNEILPIVPLWERYGNNPVLETRVGGWPSDDDILYKNAVYGDNFVIMWILDGTLGPGPAQ